MLTEAAWDDEGKIRTGLSLNELLLHLPRLSVGTLPQPCLHPPPTQLHPFIKEPMGTRKLIVRPGIFAPCCRADLLTPGSGPSAHHSSSPAQPEWMV